MSQTPQEFLQSVMNNEHQPMRMRLDAAATLARSTPNEARGTPNEAQGTPDEAYQQHDEAPCTSDKDFDSLAEGWVLSNTEDGRLEIQRHDARTTFKSDAYL